MSDTIIDLLTWPMLVIGAVFYVIGAVGLIRMPDVFTRMHAVSVSETLGAGLLILGMILQAGPSLLAVKLFFLALVLWTTGAVATHALARAALHDGVRPLLADPTGRLRETDCVDLFPELGVRLAEPLVSETSEEDGAAVAPAPAGTFGSSGGDTAPINRDAIAREESR